MSDLISRQATIDALCDNCDHVEAVCPHYPCKQYIAIENLPSTQPEPKKGKWIVHPEVKNVYGGTYIECSQCGEKYVVQHMEDEKYCRNCGAKMQEDGEEE